MIDMPDAPPQYAPIVLIAQASQAQNGDAKTDRTIGVCHLIENPPIPPGSAVNAISPVTTVWGYLEKQERLTPEQLRAEMFKTAKTSVLHGSGHGELRGTPSGNYRYFPASNYFGPDRATLLVEIGGRKVKVIYFFHVLHGVGGGDQDPYMDRKNCPQGELWKISLNPTIRTVGLKRLVMAHLVVHELFQAGFARSLGGSTATLNRS